MFGKLGTQELLVILLIVIVVFGPTQLPKLSKMFGQTMKGFKEGLDTKESEDHSNQA
ncbi:MAG: twin-arginine translocase TatA/TatE family subunit [Erysipelotrichaceae bacterium]